MAYHKFTFCFYYLVMKPNLTAFHIKPSPIPQSITMFFFCYLRCLFSERNTRKNIPKKVNNTVLTMESAFARKPFLV